MQELDDLASADLCLSDSINLSVALTDPVQSEPPLICSARLCRWSGR